MRRVSAPTAMRTRAFLCGLALLFLPRLSAAQRGPDTRATKDYAATGQLTVQIQDTDGVPFFQGATVTLLTRDSDEKLSTISDQNGRARFTILPVGQYLVEIAAPGYHTVQEQILISTAREARSLTVSMVPATGGAKVKAGSVSVSPKAVKESEKALRALQLNRLAEARQHLALSLAYDPTFADADYLMGLLLLREKLSAKAVAYLQKSLQLSPNHPTALLALGEAQYLEHDYERAAESLERFFRDQPNSPQAPVAQVYVDAIHQLLQAKAAGGTEALATTSDPSPLTSNSLGGGAASTDPELPPLPDITPATEANWAPPDVDAEKLDLNSAPGCDLGDIMQSSAKRIQQLIQNVDRFTATEAIEHFNLSPMGLETSRETRKFEYLVEIHKVDTSDLDVQEYRNGSVATEEFPGHIATVGLPTLALIFHPYLQDRYEFRCEGRSAWQGKPAWVVHFQQRTDRSSEMLTYHVGTRFVSVGLKGRAWIDADTSQIVAMESDITHPVPEIGLSRDHQLIEYGPVSFRSKSIQLWLPKSADWYCSMSGRRFHRRHSFSQFFLFSVEQNEKLGNPKEPVAPSNPG